MEDIFLKGLPSLDLHGYDTATAKVEVKDFIEENLILHNSKIVIIHGKGTGLVKKAVHLVLASNKYVSKYYIDNMNDGITIAILNVDNP